MFSKRSIERLAGAFLVAGFAAFFGHFVTLKTLGADRTTILLVLIYGFLIILSAMALYLIFRPHEQTLALFGSGALAAHGLFVVLVCALILAYFKLAQEFPATSGGETDSVAAAARALELAMDKIRNSAMVFLSLGLAALGVLIAWSRAVARWVGWLGVVGGIMGFLVLMAGLFDVIEVGSTSIPTLIALLSAFGFMLILAVRLLVRETRVIARRVANGAREPDAFVLDY